MQNLKFFLVSFLIISFFSCSSPMNTTELNPLVPLQPGQPGYKEPNPNQPTVFSNPSQGAASTTASISTSTSVNPIYTKYLKGQIFTKFLGEGVIYYFGFDKDLNFFLLPDDAEIPDNPSEENMIEFINNTPKEFTFTIGNVIQLDGISHMIRELSGVNDYLQGSVIKNISVEENASLDGFTVSITVEKDGSEISAILNHYSILPATVNPVDVLLSLENLLNLGF